MRKEVVPTWLCEGPRLNGMSLVVLGIIGLPFLRGLWLSSEKRRKKAKLGAVDDDDGKGTGPDSHQPLPGQIDEYSVVG